MSIVLPATTGYHDRDIGGDIMPGSPLYLEHIRDCLEDAHYIEAYRGRYVIAPCDCSDWDGATDYIEKVAPAGAVVVFSRHFRTGPGGAATIDVRFAARAALSVVGGTGYVNFEVFTDASPPVSLGVGALSVTLATTSYLSDVWSSAFAKLSPLTWYRVDVGLDAGTAAAVRLYQWGAFEPPLAVGDLP